MTPEAGLEADVVVAGAGHNSLIASAYLAKAGLSVIVLEARSVIGGNTVTEELTLPGFHHDSCASAHVLIQSNPLLRDNELGLDSYGLNYVFPDPALVMPFEDGACIAMSRDQDHTENTLARFSRSDARAYRAMLEEWHGTLKHVHSRYMNFAPFDAEPDSPEAERYADLSGSSALDVIHERFSEPHVRSIMTWLAFATIQDVRRAGTGILPFSVTAGRQEFGWALPLGGSIMLPRACAALVEKHGGRIITSAPVSEILVDGGQAVGVRTEDGRVVRARRAVLSTIHAALLPRVLPEGSLPSEVVTSASRWRAGLTLFAVHLALRVTARFKIGSEASPAVAGAMGTSVGLAEQIAQHDAGRVYPDDPWILVVNPCVVDPGRAPGEMSVMKVLSVAPRDLSGASWELEKPRFQNALLERVFRHTTLDEDDLLAVVSESPLDLEARNPHNYLGSCHGGELLPERSGTGRPFKGWSGYRMPIPGLYQTGATTHPGGSVSGRPGRNAAHVMLADLGFHERD